jgi:hypothetical protein
MEGWEVIIMMYEDEYEELVEGLERRFGEGQAILDWLEDKCVLSIMVIEGKSPKPWLPDYLD